MEIAAGPDGALWFTEGMTVGRITTSGLVSEFTGVGIDGPIGITAGPDGALWFANQAGDSIGRITTKGAVTNYHRYSGCGSPEGITPGPDGAMWFTCGNAIGRITTTATPTSSS